MKSAPLVLPKHGYCHIDQAMILILKTLCMSKLGSAWFYQNPFSPPPVIVLDPSIPNLSFQCRHKNCLLAQTQTITVFVILLLSVRAFILFFNLNVLTRLHYISWPTFFGVRLVFTAAVRDQKVGKPN